MSWNSRYTASSLRRPRSTRDFGSRAWRVTVGCWSLALAAGASGAEASLDALQKLSTEWVHVRAETVRLEQAWAAEKVLLEATIGGLNERAGALEQARDLAKAKTAKEREELDALRVKNAAAASDLAELERNVKDLSGRLFRLRATFPPRLSEALELPYRSLANSALGVSERAQLLATVLNRCAQFNRTLTYGEEVLTLEENGPPKAYPVIYWGLSHGYALDRGAEKAWYGSPSAQGWRWTPEPQAAAAVAELMAIYHDKADPAFVMVPARVGQRAAQSQQP